MRLIVKESAMRAPTPKSARSLKPIAGDSLARAQARAHFPMKMLIPASAAETATFVKANQIV